MMRFHNSLSLLSGAKWPQVQLGEHGVAMYKQAAKVLLEYFEPRKLIW